MSNSAHVLIIDDEPNVRLVFRTALEVAGYTINEAENGEVALEVLGRSRADLVLLDFRMPGIDGMETLRRLRKAGSDVLVVVVTAHGNIPDAVEAMKLGAIDFVSKPLSPDTLRQVVAEVLVRHANRDHKSILTHRPVEPMTTASQFAANLSQAKHALNNRWFDEAEVFLKRAIVLKEDSAEAHNLLGVLHELRNEHDASYREYKAALKADKQYGPAMHNITRYYERFTFGRSQIPVDTGKR